MSICLFIGDLLAANDELPHLAVLETLFQFGLDDEVKKGMVDVEVLLVEVFFIIEPALCVRLPPQHY